MMRLVKFQEDLEDALKMEIEPDEINYTKEGKQLFWWLKKRHKAVEKFVKMFG